MNMELSSRCYLVMLCNENFRNFVNRLQLKVVPYSRISFCEFF